MVIYHGDDLSKSTEQKQIQDFHTTKDHRLLYLILEWKMISGYHKIIQLFGGHHGFQPQKCINLVVSRIPEN